MAEVDVAEVRELLARLIAAVDAEQLDVSPAQRAHLAGSLDALDSLIAVRDTTV